MRRDSEPGGREWGDAMTFEGVEVEGGVDLGPDTVLAVSSNLETLASAR